MSRVMTIASLWNIKRRATTIVKPVCIQQTSSCRSAHSVRKDSKQPENDSGLTDPNLSVWRSVNADHKEVEHMPTDQSVNILNYYKERWIQENKEKRKVEIISGNEVTKENDVSDKKSLYSQLARKMPSADNRHYERNMPGIHCFAMEDQSTITAFDPFKHRKTPEYSQSSLEGDYRDGGLEQLKGQNTSSYWSRDRPAEQQSTQMHSRLPQKDPRPEDSGGPYRPAFRMAEFLKTNQTEDSDKNDMSGGSCASPKSNEAPQEDVKNVKTFQPPSGPDFKAT